jgi:hypothetical protein
VQSCLHHRNDHRELGANGIRDWSKLLAPDELHDQMVPVMRHLDNRTRVRPTSWRQPAAGGPSGSTRVSPPPSAAGVGPLHVRGLRYTHRATPCKENGAGKERTQFLGDLGSGQWTMTELSSHCIDGRMTRVSRLRLGPRTTADYHSTSVGRANERRNLDFSLLHEAPRSPWYQSPGRRYCTGLRRSLLRIVEMARQRCCT